MPEIKTLADAHGFRVEQLRVWLRARSRPFAGLSKADLIEQVGIELLRTQPRRHRPGFSHGGRGLRAAQTAPRPPSPPTKAQSVHDTASQLTEWTAYAPTLAAREKVLANASEGVSEYLRFMSLKASMSDWNAEFLSPSAAIDSVWHSHILDTRVYGFHCRKMFGEVVHHNPDGPGDRDQPQRYQRTLVLYQAMYGEEPPAEWWPPKDLGPPAAQVTLMTLMGVATVIRVAPDMLVSDVLKRFYSATSDADDAQGCVDRLHARLIYAGRQLSRNKTLADYDVRDNATLHVLMPPRGC